MAKQSNRRTEVIDAINRNFDRAHYLSKDKRSLKSLLKSLYHKSEEYRKQIKAAQITLSSEARRWIKIRDREYVATVVAGKGRKICSFGTSYEVPKEFSHQILQKLSALGEPGSASGLTNTKNTIGKCAEVKSANHILLANNAENLAAIEFTISIRPRTSERIPRCQNCTNIFGAET